MPIAVAVATAIGMYLVMHGLPFARSASRCSLAE
jgi:hypothetical protein